MRILIFIGLKVVEAIGLAILLILLSMLGSAFHYLAGDGWLPIYTIGGFLLGVLMGVFCLVFLSLACFVLFGIGYGIYSLIKKNWEWAKRLGE